MKTEKQLKDKRKLIIFPVIAITVMLGLITLITFKNLKPDKQIVQISTHKVETSAKRLFKGIVRHSHTDNYMLDTSLGAQPTVKVKSGQSITAGQVIMTYDTKESDFTSLSYAVKAAELTLAQNQENVATAQQKAGKLQVKYNQALTDKAALTSHNSTVTNHVDPAAIQAQIISNSEAIKQQDYVIQTAQLNLEQAQATLSNVQPNESSPSNLRSDLTSLEYAVKQAELALSQAQNTMQDLQEQASSFKTQHQQALEDQKAAQDNETQLENSQDSSAVQAEIDSNDQNIQQLTQSVATNSLALQSAQASLAEAQRTGQVTVKAKNSGVVKLGDPDDTSKPLISISSTVTVVTGQISEFDYDKLKVGDKVQIKTINLQQTISGVVASIDTTPTSGSTSETTSSTSYYTFTITPSKNLQVGNNVQISLSDDTLHIPSSAVKDGYVRLKKDGKFVKKAVKTQAASNGKLLVISGLKAGDVIAEDGEVK
ncbi:MAG: hypothetical protein LBV19_04750 [Streptococcaceae bacterium]|jgi:HlyD family secretion protein|nr:hypothetical protein [Streptococcaceae bacterium]